MDTKRHAPYRNAVMWLAQNWESVRSITPNVTDPANQAFSEWVQEMFPGLGEHDARAALWFSEESSDLLEIPAGMSNPQSIRQWFNDSQATKPPRDDLDLSTAVKLPPVETVAPIATKVNKLKAMADRGTGQEAETAQRYLRKQAERLGMAVVMQSMDI